ncbi:acyl-CoA reductase [Elusimicrobiota bacterium]
MGTRYIFGEWKQAKTPLKAMDAARICEQAQIARKEFSNYPIDKILRVLGRMRDRWLDPNYKARKAVEKILPKETGFSPEMIELGLNELCSILDPKELQKKINTELGNIPISPNYQNRSGTGFSWHPLGTMLHVLSGNVFLVAAGSLIEGLITGNINILKMSSSENKFLPKFIESLIECDHDGVISRSFAFIEYSSTQADVIKEFKKRVDGIVVWGGEQAVRAYRDGLPARTKLIVFGPKLSLAVITKKGLAPDPCAPSSTAKKLAYDISIWDQNACTAPQMCFVEGAANATLLAEELSKELEAASKTLPPGPIDFHTAADIRKMRTTFEVAQAKGKGSVCGSTKNLDWTIIVDKNSVIEPSPLHRTIRIIAFTDLKEIIKRLEEWRGYIQTIGLAACQEQRWRMSAEFSRAGALKITDIGLMAAGKIDDPHDGSYDLPQFMRLAPVRFSTSEDAADPVDLLPAEQMQDLIDARLRTLIDKARCSKYYGRILKGLDIDSTDDLEKIPILTREKMEKNMPPQGIGLCTGPYQGGYVSRSGGSTGVPKFSIYDGHDWEAMIGSAVKALEAAGLAQGDRIANCMMAGNLYGSFVSFDHINCRAGVMTFAFASNVEPGIFLDMWRKFRINVIQGIPGTIVPLLRKAKKLEPSFTIAKVIYAGSPLSRGDHDWIKTSLKAQRISSIIGANDGGQIAYQCKEMSGALHHVVDDFNYIEIIDDKGSRVKDAMAGRIAITSLLKHAFPLIRYDIGDKGRIIPGTCKCGRSGRRLEYLGRADDIIVVGLMNLRYADVRSSLAGLPVSETQVVARNNDDGEYLVIGVESDDDSPGLKDKIYSAVINSTGMFKDRLKKGDIVKIDVKVCKPGGLPRNPVSGKIKNLVDERT